MAAIRGYSGVSVCVDDERTDVAHYSTPLKRVNISNGADLQIFQRELPFMVRPADLDRPDFEFEF